MSDTATAVISWYRVPLSAKDRKELARKSDLLGGLQTVGFLACYLATLGLSMYSFYHWPWEMTAGFVFLHGTISSLMIVAVHELTHGTVFETKALNVFFARLFAFLGWINHEMFQVSHARHHRYTLHQPDDLEVVLPLHLVLRDFLLTGFIDPMRAVNRKSDSSVANIFRIAAGRFDGPWELSLFPPAEREKRRAPITWARLLLLGHGTILGVSLALHLWLLPVLISLSSFYGGWLLFLCGNTQHIGLQDKVPDFRLCCRTFTTNPVIEFLYWHMNYHIEHHMYAAVPCYRLGKLHRLIKQELQPCRHGLVATWMEIGSILKKQKADPSYQYVAPLPTSA